MCATLMATDWHGDLPISVDLCDTLNLSQMKLSRVVHLIFLLGQQRRRSSPRAMATADAGLEELQSRLVTFTDQLQSINELLQADSQNEEFVSISKDLVEVIQLTKEAVRQALVSPGACVQLLIPCSLCMLVD